METIIKIVIVLSICSFYTSVYGHTQEKNNVICFVNEKNDNIKKANVKSLIARDIESSLIKEKKYTVSIRDTIYLEYREIAVDEYENQYKNKMATSTIVKIGQKLKENQELKVNYICWAEVDRIDNVYIRLVNVSSSRLEGTANAYIDMDKRKLVVKENTNSFLDDLKLSPLPALTWNNFSRLYKNFSNQFFFNVGNGITYGNRVGASFGGRFGSIWGGGFQVGLGLGKDSSGKYLHYAGGVKLYCKCFFLSANLGTVEVKKYEIETLKITDDGHFNYYKKEKTEFNHGLSFLLGADYCFCFRKNTVDKWGLILNVAIGSAYADKKWGFAWNVGIGVVLPKII
jgi:hypothetical protein